MVVEFKLESVYEGVPFTFFDVASEKSEFVLYSSTQSVVKLFWVQLKSAELCVMLLAVKAFGLIQEAGTANSKSSKYK